MKSLLKKVKRRNLHKRLKRQLVTESIFAMGRFRQTGQSPTQEDSPLLMCIWRRARDHILEGNATAIFNVHGVGMGLRVTAIELRDDQNRLSKFTAYDASIGSLLLVGDMNGPVFPSSAVQATTENQPQNNTKIIS